MIRHYSLKGFSFFIEDDRKASIEVPVHRDRVRCSIQEARNVYRAVKVGALEHHEGKDAAQTISEVRAFLAHEYLFEEYDRKRREKDTVCTIVIRNDCTAYIRTYTENEWLCDTMLGRRKDYLVRCSDGKCRNYEHE